MSFQTAHVSLPMPGERANGDAALVRQDKAGRVLLAVIDGLGHGPIAAEASTAAVGVLESISLELPLFGIMEAVHEQLRSTRGAAGTVCVIHDRHLEACAVGNVQLLSLNCTVPLVLSAGVLGQRVARFRVCTAELKVGARLALVSDGITSQVRLDEFRHRAPSEACKLIMGRYRRNEDDATVLVADLEG